MLTKTRPRAKRIAATQSLAWRPLEKQYLDRDTTYLLDATEEAALDYGVSGLNSMRYTDAFDQWQMYPGLGEVGCGVDIVDGKYRKGLSANTAGVDGQVWAPSDGLLAPTEFTIEFWAQTESSAWSAASGAWMSIGYNINQAGAEGVWVWNTGGSLRLDFAHQQSGSVAANITYSLISNPIAAGVWTHIAVTYVSNTLTLYVNGSSVGTASAVAPFKWSSGMNQAGLALGQRQPEFVLSDLRISRRARTPGATISVSGPTTVTIDPATTTGTKEENLCGVLHRLDVDPAIEAQGLALVNPYVKSFRTDKMVNATPIKAGGTDATHPTLGHSGSYSYDWQVVDRTIAFAQQLGAEPYISLDSTPQILGGGGAPDATLPRSGNAGFNTQVPNDMTAFGTICVDLVHHITSELGVSVPRWGVWNEPVGSFWSGTNTQYYQLFAAVSHAIKAYNPALKIGGPETVPFDTTVIPGLINYCAANSVPLDFISWHFYSGLLGEVALGRALIDATVASSGLGNSLEMINGEWTGCDGITDRVPPFYATGGHVGDWNAAYMAAAFIEFAKYGVKRSILLFGDGPALPTTIPAAPPGGLFRSTDITPWATFNIYKLWSMLKPTLVSATTTVDADPGTSALAAKDTNGLDVLLACLHYRKDHNYSVSLSGLSAYNGSPVTVYVVDDQHSNVWDAGNAHASLESYSAGTVAGGSVTVSLRPRAATLVRVGS